MITTNSIYLRKSQSNKKAKKEQIFFISPALQHIEQSHTNDKNNSCDVTDVDPVTLATSNDAHKSQGGHTTGNIHITVIYIQVAFGKFAP